MKSVETKFQEIRSDVFSKHNLSLKQDFEQKCCNSTLTTLVFFSFFLFFFLVIEKELEDFERHPFLDLWSQGTNKLAFQIYYENVLLYPLIPLAMLVRVS